MTLASDNSYWRLTLANDDDTLSSDIKTPKKLEMLKKKRSDGLWRFACGNIYENLLLDNMLYFINHSPWCIVAITNNNQISAKPIKIVPHLIQPYLILFVAKKLNESILGFIRYSFPVSLILHQRSFSSSFWHISETCD